MPVRSCGPTPSASRRSSRHSKRTCKSLCGRRRREDEIDPAAGFLVKKNVGDRVEPGETLAWLCLGEREPPRPNMERELAALFHLGDTKVKPPPLAVERL